MKASVTFKISLSQFDEVARAEENIGNLSKAQTALTEYMAAKLKDAGLTVGEVWIFAMIGSCCDVGFRGRKLAFGIVWLREVELWQIVVSAAHSNMSIFSDLSLAHMENAKEIEELSQVICDILMKDQNVSNIKWCADDEK